MHSLRTKFIIIICIICIICIGLTAGISYGLASSIMMDSSVKNESLTSRKAAQEIETWMNAKGEFLNTVRADHEPGLWSDHGNQRGMSLHQLSDKRYFSKTDQSRGRTDEMVC